MFRVRCTYRQGWLRVNATGELDLESAPIFQEKLRQAVKRHQAYRVVLDFGDLTFMDSAGIGAVLSSYRYVRDLKGEMKLGPVSSRVRPVIRLASLDRILEPADGRRRTGQGREKNA